MSRSPQLVRQDGMIAGVCAGIAAYLGWSPFVVRFIFFLLLLPGGLPGIIPYLILWLIMPRAR